MSKFFIFIFVFVFVFSILSLPFGIVATSFFAWLLLIIPDTAPFIRCPLSTVSMIMTLLLLLMVHPALILTTTTISITSYITSRHSLNLVTISYVFRTFRIIYHSVDLSAQQSFAQQKSVKMAGATTTLGTKTPYRLTKIGFAPRIYLLLMSLSWVESPRLLALFFSDKWVTCKY